MCRLYSFISQNIQVTRPAHETLVMKLLASFVTIRSSSPPHSLSSLENLTIHESTILPFQTSLSQLFYIPCHQQNTSFLVSTLLYASFFPSGIFFPVAHVQILLSLKCSNRMSPPPQSFPCILQPVTTSAPLNSRRFSHASFRSHIKHSLNERLLLKLPTSYHSLSDHSVLLS